MEARRPATARERGAKVAEVDAKADDFINRFKQQLKRVSDYHDYLAEAKDFIDDDDDSLTEAEDFIVVDDDDDDDGLAEAEDFIVDDIDDHLAEADLATFNYYPRRTNMKKIEKIFTASRFLLNFLCIPVGLIVSFFTYIYGNGRNVFGRTFGSTPVRSLQLHPVEEDQAFDEKFSSGISSIKGNKVFGFDDEARELQHKLIGGWRKLEVISVTGMGGIGKTTLAYRLYDDDPFVVNHFHLRGWTSVSQFCAKRKLFHDILSCFLNESDPIFTMSDEDMRDKLYKSLKGRRYLIVLDDIWDIEIWNDIKICFPDDDNGSRILITTRISDVAFKVGSSCLPHPLRFLNQNESWDLFKHKVFADKNFPEELVGIGQQIVANCEGLPLAIVVIAGILAKEVKTEEFWRNVGENMRSIICSDSDKFMDILTLSYEHLPPYLKSCFLYVGSFPEDYEIPVKRLIRSWIAEGFIQYSLKRSLENVAENYLTNLINRSLVIVVKRRADGGIKSCRMHDMLRDLCQRKSEEKKFVQLICKCKRNGSCNQSRFHDCQYFHFYNLHFVHEGLVFNEQTIPVFKLLKTLDLRHINLDSFPERIVQLRNLKYLALRVNRIECLPPSIVQLWKLKTFILDGEKGGRVTLTAHIFKMVRLRHLQVSQEMVVDKNCLLFYMKMRNEHERSFQMREDTFTPVLYNLQSISHLCPSGSFVPLLSKTPNLRKVGFHFTLSNTNERFSFPCRIYRLVHLENLKFEYQTLGMVPFSLPSPRFFPASLKKMTLVGSHVKWTEMSAIVGLLPNLEVLKLKDNFFSGPLWETSDNGFRRLKFLKLSHMDLERWITSSSDHFPSLEWLVINGCLDLEEIPSEIGDIPTLKIIEVYRSSDSTVESARQIQKSQSNEDLKVLIYQQFEEN